MSIEISIAGIAQRIRWHEEQLAVLRPLLDVLKHAESKGVLSYDVAPAQAVQQAQPTTPPLTGFGTPRKRRKRVQGRSNDIIATFREYRQILSLKDVSKGLGRLGKLAKEDLELPPDKIKELVGKAMFRLSNAGEIKAYPGKRGYYGLAEWFREDGSIDPQYVKDEEETR